MTEPVTSLDLSVALKNAGAPQDTGEEGWRFWSEPIDKSGSPIESSWSENEDLGYENDDPNGRLLVCDQSYVVLARAFTAGELWGFLKKHGSIEVSEKGTSKALSTLTFWPNGRAGYRAVFPSDGIAESLGGAYLWFLETSSPQQSHA